MEKNTEVKLNFEIRQAMKFDIGRILELQCENSILHLGPENLHKKGGLETILTPNELKNLVVDKSIFIATTTMNDEDQVQPGLKWVTLGYVIFQEKKITEDEQSINFFRGKENPSVLLSQIVVDEEFRKNGVGTKLIKSVLKKFKGSGKAIVSFAAEKNWPVIGLMKKNGFNYSERGVNRTFWNVNVINLMFERVIN